MRQVLSHCLAENRYQHVTRFPWKIKSVYLQDSTKCWKICCQMEYKWIFPDKISKFELLKNLQSSLWFSFEKKFFLFLWSESLPFLKISAFELIFAFIILKMSIIYFRKIQRLRTKAQKEYKYKKPLEITRETQSFIYSFALKKKNIYLTHSPCSANFLSINKNSLFQIIFFFKKIVWSFWGTRPLQKKSSSFNCSFIIIIINFSFSYNW